MFDELTNFCLDTIKKHEVCQVDTQTNDFIGFYLQEIRKRSDKTEDSTFEGQVKLSVEYHFLNITIFTQEKGIASLSNKMSVCFNSEQDGRMNLATILGEFIVAGSDTNHSAFMWALYFMILHPDVQEKVQTELDQVTGGIRMPTTDDRRNTPYTESVIQEIFRKANVFPVAPRATLSGGYVDNGNYYLPPKTKVSMNLGAVVNDPINFPDPEKFNPHRFLDSKGSYKPDKKVISFGLGKRRCPGKKYHCFC